MYPDATGRGGRAQAHLAALSHPARVNTSAAGHGAFLLDGAWRARILTDMRLTLDEGAAAAATAAAEGTTAVHVNGGAATAAAAAVHVNGGAATAAAAAVHVNGGSSAAESGCM
jgi:hypothetical protein